MEVGMEAVSMMAMKTREQWSEEIHPKRYQDILLTPREKKAYKYMKIKYKREVIASQWRKDRLLNTWCQAIGYPAKK